jgi:hypothetical protein
MISNDLKGHETVMFCFAHPVITKVVRFGPAEDADDPWSFPVRQQIAFWASCRAKLTAFIAHFLSSAEVGQNGLATQAE